MAEIIMYHMRVHTFGIYTILDQSSDFKQTSTGLIDDSIMDKSAAQLNVLWRGSIYPTNVM